MTDKLNKEEKDHFSWMSKSYCQMVGDAISLTSVTETLINFSIARLITKEQQPSRDIVKYLVLKMKFGDKLTLLGRLIKDKKPEIFDKYEQDIEDMVSIYRYRNKLAHSSLMSSEKEIRKFDKTRIPYDNQSVSNQILYVTITEAQENKNKLMKLNGRFAEMSKEIKSI